MSFCRFDVASLSEVQTVGASCLSPSAFKYMGFGLGSCLACGLLLGAPSPVWASEVVPAEVRITELEGDAVSGADMPEATNQLELAPGVLEQSPVLQRWNEEIPNVLSDIRHDPSFRTRLRLNYSEFPSTDRVGGLQVGVSDWFIG